MEALRLRDGRVVLDVDRCIGCGLCVSTCPTGSLRLARKRASDQPRVPRDYARALIHLGRVRGKLGIARLLATLVRSGVDRLLAAK
jgi:Fe-S-cluster-containing hydrogenase component 2